MCFFYSPSSSSSPSTSHSCCSPNLSSIFLSRLKHVKSFWFIIEFYLYSIFSISFICFILILYFSRYLSLFYDEFFARLERLLLRFIVMFNYLFISSFWWDSEIFCFDIFILFTFFSKEKLKWGTFFLTVFYSFDYSLICSEMFIVPSFTTLWLCYFY